MKAFVEKKGETLYNIFLNELNHNIKKEFDQFRREFLEIPRALFELQQFAVHTGNVVVSLETRTESVGI